MLRPRKPPAGLLCAPVQLPLRTLPIPSLLSIVPSPPQPRKRASDNPRILRLQLLSISGSLLSRQARRSGHIPRCPHLGACLISWLQSRTPLEYRGDLVAESRRSPTVHLHWLLPKNPPSRR